MGAGDRANMAGHAAYTAQGGARSVVKNKSSGVVQNIYWGGNRVLDKIQGFLQGESRVRVFFRVVRVPFGLPGWAPGIPYPGFPTQGRAPGKGSRDPYAGFPTQGRGPGMRGRDAG